MKAVLVIDMPTTCEECQFCGRGGVNLERYVCCFTGEHSEEPHLVGCPLRPLPEQMLWGHSADFIEGYNDCLDEIIGETERYLGETE